MHILLGVLIAFVCVAIFAHRGRKTRGCRWREDRTGDKGTLRKYRCAACGAEAFTSTVGPPDACKSNFNPPSL